MLFNGSEWINKRNKNINQVGSTNAAKWIPDSEIGTSLAVFGGNEAQRMRVVGQGIARCFGQMGIVIVHNNWNLENMLKDFKNQYVFQAERYPQTPVCFVNSENPCYEPLYGLNSSRVIDAVYPRDARESSANMQQHICAAALMKYIKILEYKNVPVDLDNLLYLSNMELEVLEQRELGNVPVGMRDDILISLSQDNILRQVRADINYFAAQMDDRIWSGQRPASNISIIEAVKNRAMLSVKVPSNSVAIMDYLSVEINALLDSGLQFLLVVDSVNFQNSTIKNSIVIAPSQISIILSAKDIQEIDTAGTSSGIGILNKMSKIILFQCANAIAAKQYSELIGNYLRQFENYNYSEGKGLLDILIGHGEGRGKGVSEQLYARIGPEELVRLGDGAVLINQVNGQIDIAKRFI